MLHCNYFKGHLGPIVIFLRALTILQGLRFPFFTKGTYTSITVTYKSAGQPSDKFPDHWREGPPYFNP